MPIPTLPSSPAPSAVKFRLKAGSVVSQAESGKILGRSKGTSYYEMTLTYPPMRRDQFGPLAAFLQENARPAIFEVTVDPLTGTAGETVGNHINFNNDSKLHMVTGTGPTTVTPPMRNAGGLIVSSPVTMRCSLMSDNQQLSIAKDGLVRVEINVVERI